jgi:Ca2+/H+ antiporter, TMEM165/GDT1 family
MESLLLTFISVLLAECGDRSQRLAAALAQRTGKDRIVIIAVLFATLSISVMAAFAGAQIARWISEDPVRLFCGITYIFSGMSMLLWQRRVDLLENWKIGPFWTTFLGIFILQFVDRSQFLVVGNAAMAQYWGLTALGGWLGTAIAIIAAIQFKEKLTEQRGLAYVRKGGGILFLLFGFYLALTAWRIL